MRSTALVLTTAGWTGLYVASKIHLALAGRLGVDGGPAVPVEHYARFAPGGVAAAQWGNAAVGAAGVALLLAALMPAPRRLPRWVRWAPPAALAVMAAVGAAVMLGRAAVTGSGGWWFGLYCVVWAALLGATAVALYREPAQRSGSPRTRSMSAERSRRFSTNRG